MIENELRKLIGEAKMCLTDLRPYTTHVAQLALEDMNTAGRGSSKSGRK